MNIYEEETLKELKAILKEQQKTNELLEQTLRVFRQYDEGYSEMVEKEGIVKKPT
ncbi:MAG TPA: hypothetical protein VMZ91_01940 [Candidatus Paceibacterota bacterium]|nr:hypothetical protein [Candidatus Paceibacterota bacterium]